MPHSTPRSPPVPVGASVLATVLATVIAGPALAGCPNAWDLADGIWVRYDDGSVTRYISEGSGYVTETTSFDDPEDGVDFAVTMLGGLYEISFIDLPGGMPDPDSQGSQTYSADLQAHVPLLPGTSFASWVTTTYADGTSDPRERYVVSAGQPAKIDIGLCRYTAFPVTHTYVGEEGLYGLTYQFLPDLGISLFQLYRDLGDAPEAVRALRISDTPL